MQKSRKAKTAEREGYRLYRNSFAGSGAENWLALALAIVGNKTPDKALRAMGILPPSDPDRIHKSARYKQEGAKIYILNKICGMKRCEIVRMFDIGEESIRNAVKYFKTKEAAGQWGMNL